MDNQILIFMIIVFFVVLISIQYSINKIIVLLKNIIEILNAMNMRIK